MQYASYALRDDVYSIFLLEDAGNLYNKFCQISIFARNIVRPDFIGKYMYFTPFWGTNGKYNGTATDIQISIDDNSYFPHSNYIAVIDSEVEFEITNSTIRKLSHNYMPAWGIKSYLDYFNDHKFGFLLFLRVYKVNQNLDVSYLKKGILSSSQIFKLYDENGNEANLPIDGICPVISDNKFSYLKDEILHLLKVENVLISIYDNSVGGLNSLKERIKADNILQSRKDRWTKSHLQWLSQDSDDDFDMAQLDYESIYKDILQLCPNMKNIVKYCRNIQAARLGEYEYYLNEVVNNSENIEKAKARLFDMSFRSAIKNALYYYKRYGFDIEDAFQEASIGIVMAIKKYNKNILGNFPSYVALRILSIIDRDLFHFYYELPYHYIEIARLTLNQLSDGIDQCNLNQVEFCDLFDFLLKNTEHNVKISKRISFMLSPKYSFTEVLYNPLFEHFFCDDYDFVEDLTYSSLRNVILDFIDSLPIRERSVLLYRFGFYSYSDHTLEEIGNIFNVTRERIRQIERKALKKLFKMCLRKNLIDRDRYLSILSDWDIN